MSFSSSSSHFQRRYLNVSGVLFLLLLSVALMASSVCHAFAPLSTTTTTTTASSRLFLKSDGMSPEERQVAVDKAVKVMTAFTNTYLKNTGTTLCSDKSVPAVVIQGLAEHKVDLGAPLCPCRFYDDKEAEAKDGYWNCPCKPMLERKVCHCMLFLTEDNAFAGTEQDITIDEVKEGSKGMTM